MRCGHTYLDAVRNLISWLLEVLQIQPMQWFFWIFYSWISYLLNNIGIIMEKTNLKVREREYCSNANCCIIIEEETASIWHKFQPWTLQFWITHVVLIIKNLHSSCGSFGRRLLGGWPSTSCYIFFPKPHFLIVAGRSTLLLPQPRRSGFRVVLIFPSGWRTMTPLFSEAFVPWSRGLRLYCMALLQFSSFPGMSNSGKWSKHLQLKTMFRPPSWNFPLSVISRFEVRISKYGREMTLVFGFNLLNCKYIVSPSRVP